MTEPIDLLEDLKARWLPSSEQMAAADAVLRAGYPDAMRYEHFQIGRDAANRKETGVYTAHLLINKEYGFWTADVELLFLDGVFLEREQALIFVHEAARQHYVEHGKKVVGGWAWHPRPGEAAVWEDICSRFPTE